jgi:hypothetical protein
MKVVIIGTDHRLQASVMQDPITGRWLRRRGMNYRRLILYCIDKLGVKAILEETHPKQERVEPSLASVIAKERGLIWQTIGCGEIEHEKALEDDLGPLAGNFHLETQKYREQLMYDRIMNALQKHDCVLAIVGFTHLGTLARLVEAEKISVAALTFTHPLVVNERLS